MSISSLLKQHPGKEGHDGSSGPYNPADFWQKTQESAAEQTWELSVQLTVADLIRMLNALLSDDFNF